MKYHRTIFLSFILILQFGCIHKTTIPVDTISDGQKFVKGGALTGGRSRASIMRGIMPILNQFRKLYNEEYPDSCKPTLKVVVFFKIDYLGNVVSCEVSKSNSSNPKFDSAILVIVKSTKFEEIDLKNDITEVIYPLCFSK